MLHFRRATFSVAGAAGRRRGLAMEVFDRTLKRHHRERAALCPQVGDYAYLRDEVAERLIERLEDVHESYEFGNAADVGCGSGHVRRALVGRGVSSLTELDYSPAMLAAAGRSEVDFEVVQQEMEDETRALPRESFDLVTSSMTLHWVNDLPGALVSFRRALKPNGLFLGAMLGGDTLQE